MRSNIKDISNNYLHFRAKTPRINNKGKASGYNEDKLFKRSHLSYSKLNDYGYDVYAKDQTKATGIKHLIAYLNIDKKNTIAFGDGHKDREMIEYCEIGVAMGNALPKVKEVSNYITDDIDNNGIYNAMKYLKLI